MAFAVAKQDIDLWQGDDWGAVVYVFNDDDSEPDLTGYVPLAHIRRGVADNAPTVDLVMSSTIYPPNQILLTITHAESTLLAGLYVWDLELKSPGGEITTVLQGNASVQQEVTRA